MRRIFQFVLLSLIFTGTVSCQSIVSLLDADRQTAVQSQPTAIIDEPAFLPIPATATPRPTRDLSELAAAQEETPAPAAALPTPQLSFPLGLNTVGRYIVPQQGSPAAIPNFSHPEAGCSWMGVGGQVFGLSGWPLQSMVVELGGVLEGQTMSALALTGSATQWGPGGYEFTLASAPVASEGTLWIRVHDLEGNQLSSQIPFPTFGDCNRNAILLNLLEVEFTPPAYSHFVPVVLRQTFFADEFGGGLGE